MASFCWDCAPKQWVCEPEQNDLVNPDCPADSMFFYVCEGCGVGYFDRHGKRVPGYRYEKAEGGWVPIWEGDE